MKWNKKIFNRIFRASGLKSKDHLKRMIRDLIKSLGIDLEEESG